MDKFRILVLDDDPSAVETIARALRDAGMEYLIKRVETRSTFIREMSQSPPDVVLLEDKLRQWDGVAALQMLQERFPSIPAVFVTGSLGDEMAVERIKAGAADYVLKNNLVRLAPAITSAVERARARAEQERARETLRASEERFRRLIEDASDAIAIVDVDGYVRYVSPAIRAIAGCEPDELLGKPLSERVHPDDAAKAARSWAAIMREPGKILRSTQRYFHNSGKWRTVESCARNLLGTPLIDGIVVTMRDITERERYLRALAAIGAANAALVHSDQAPRLLEDICNVLVRIGGYRLAWIGLAQPDARKSVTPVAFADHDDSYLNELDVEWSEGEKGKGPTGTAIRTGRLQIARNIATDPRLAPWRAKAVKHGFASSIALPLIESGKAFGALSIYSAEPDAFDADEVALLEQLAANVAYGMHVRSRVEAPVPG